MPEGFSECCSVMHNALSFYLKKVKKSYRVGFKQYPLIGIDLLWS